MAAHFADEVLTELVTDRPTGGAYRVSLLSPGAGVVETPLETRYLGES